VARAAVSPGCGLCRATKGPRRSIIPAQVEKEGFRDPARGNSGTVR
jgi:hypothetical protein